MYFENDFKGGKKKGCKTGVKWAAVGLSVLQLSSIPICAQTDPNNSGTNAAPTAAGDLAPAQPTQAQPSAAPPTAPGAEQNGGNATNANNQQVQPNQQQPLPPTAQPGAPERTYGTNGSETVPEYLQRDQAITRQDQAILAQMRQSIFPANQPMAEWMTTIHFILKDGAVRLVGNVPNAQEKQHIESTVTQIPGVTRVYNALTVSGPEHTPGAGYAAPQPNNTPPPNTPPPLPPTGYTNGPK